MVAVFTGNGLGLFQSSVSQLGSALGGGSSLGQSGLHQYVNLATGNLVLQSADETISVRGFTSNFLRTYNSRGAVGTVGQDGFVTGYERRIEAVSSNTLRLHVGDGDAIEFFRVGASDVYRSSAGDGAHDTIARSGDRWVYAEGSSRREERYDALSGRLLEFRDSPSGAAYEVRYDQGRVQEVRAIDGSGDQADALIFEYHYPSGRLRSVQSRDNGTVRTQVFFSYDTFGRLEEVVTDLVPHTNLQERENWNSGNVLGNDGERFRTRFEYFSTPSKNQRGGSNSVEADLRLKSITQSDGTIVSYDYHGDGRLKSVTRGDLNADDSDGFGETTTFAYRNGETEVTDSLGRSWIYKYDANRQLTEVQAPAVDGLRDVTGYTYDTAGNVTQVKTTRGTDTLAQLDYTYDGNGNRTWEWDLAGNAIARTYDEHNQLLTETRHAGVDADRDGSIHRPTGGLTTHFAYDAQDRLRFVVDATGNVTERTYASSGNGAGQLASVRQYIGARFSGSEFSLSAVQAWTSGKADESALTTYEYDIKGRLALNVTYATVDSLGRGVLDEATEIVRYAHDLHGRLLQRATVRGANRLSSGTGGQDTELVSYAYDGMGRLLSATESGLTRSYTYTDSSQRSSILHAATGVVEVITHNAAGRQVGRSATGGSTSRTSRFFYDSAGQLRASEDATGARTYFYYDDKGRLEIEIDATGAAVVYEYDARDLRVAETRHAARLDTSGWINDGALDMPAAADLGLDHADEANRRTEFEYDDAARLWRTTDAAGTVTENSYDGAHRLIAVTATSADPAEAARVTRHFYDAAGRRVGSLDAEGYLSEFGYDAAGRLVRETRHAKPTAATLRAAGSLAALRPAADQLNDQITRHFHDGRGNRIGTLDAQGFLTEWIFDAQENQRAERRYAQALDDAAHDKAFATLLAEAAETEESPVYLESRRSFDANGRLSTERNREGIVTRYHYDDAGRLVRTERAADTTEVREGNLRYNAFGELIGELGGEASLELLPTMSEAEIDQIYAQYGTRHSYDALGRRIESIDAEGNKTWYFYDASSRLRYTVRGVDLTVDDVVVQNGRGEVSELRYTAFGEVEETISYSGAIELAVPGDRASVETSLAALQFVDGIDSRRQHFYTTRGLLDHLVDATGAESRYEYTGFGELRYLRRDITRLDGTEDQISTRYDYDRRGLQIGTVEDDGGLARAIGVAFDAFGRGVQRTDPLGRVVTVEYDRLGREIASERVVQGRVERSETRYDAHGRIVRQFDPFGRATEYTYDDAVRSVVMKTPEGVEVSTYRTAHGETLRIVDAAGTSHFTYDADGQLEHSRRENSDGTIVSQSDYTYDARGLRDAEIDGEGKRVEYAYDAAGRVLSRTVDPDGLAYVTRYTYDGQGRRIDIVEQQPGETADSIVTIRASRFEYDGEGRVVELRVDPDGHNLRTRYEWDALGRQLSVTEGYETAAAQTSRYEYDDLGRRTADVRAPGTLDLRTEYSYDGNDNLVRRRDADGAVTRYAYDEANRRVFTIDPEGGVTRAWYDEAGRQVASRAYATALGDLAIAQIDATAVGARLAEIERRVPADDSRDRVQYQLFDQDGRATYTIDRWLNDETPPVTVGLVSQTLYDTAGRVDKVLVYSDPVVLRAPLEARLRQQGELSEVAAKLLRETIDALVADQRQRTGDNKPRETRYGYDAAGRLTSTTDALGQTEQYTYDKAGRRDSLTNRSNVTWNYEYDGAGRLAKELSPWVEVTRYDDNGQIVTERTRIATRFEYDAAGNLTKRIENADAAVSDQRVTEYRYDERGLQIGIVFPPAGEVSDAGVFSIPDDALGVETTITRDASGRAVVERDVRGYHSYKVYDGAGRVRYDIDAEGYVSCHEYDGAGRQTRLIRHAVALTGLDGTPLTKETVDAHLVAVDRSKDRTLESDYDGRGNRIELRQSAIDYVDAAGNVATGSPTTRFQYDALGRMVKQSVLLEGVADTASAVWADAFHYYDVLGRRELTVDAERYVTGWMYNAFGEAFVEVQFARRTGTADLRTDVLPALPQAGDQQIGFDRIVYFGYDAIGRRTSQTQAKLVQNAVGNNVIETLRTITEYTKENQVGAVSANRVRADGSLQQLTRTETRYDALGRVSSVTETARGVLITSTSPGSLVADWLAKIAAGSDLTATELYVDASPHTAMKYDAFGNVVESRRFANGRSGVADPVADAGRDQITTMRYDGQGRAVIVRDAEGNQSYNAYDAADNLTRMWFRLDGGADSVASADAVDGDFNVSTLHTYDKLGRLRSSHTTRRPAGGGPAITDGRLHVRYNAFGEVAERAADDTFASKETAISRYNAAGWLVASNADSGTERRYRYNLAGHQLREERDWTDIGIARTAVTINHTDRLGRATARTLPSHLANAATTSEVSMLLDRWGNVLEHRDARGSVTTYRYNDNNQAYQQTAPEVKVVTEQGIELWQTPTTRWRFDLLGRLTAVTDANNQTSRIEYNGAGQVIRNTDAAGLAVLHAYDALGRALASQRSTAIVDGEDFRYVTTRQYDQLDRIVAQGDFREGIGEAHTGRETYTLNQRGDRIQVATTGAGTHRYQYDSRGLLISSHSDQGVRSTFAYDELGRKTSETTGVGHTQTWRYDFFGRLQAHQDLSGGAYTYDYDDRSGLQTELISPYGPRIDHEPGVPSFPGDGTATRRTWYYANVDPEQHPITYTNAWLIVQRSPTEWGWDPIPDWMNFGGEGPEFNLTVTPPATGRFHIAVVGVDERGAAGSTAFFIDVLSAENRQPTVLVPARVEVKPNAAIKIPVSISDPDGDALQVQFWTWYTSREGVQEPIDISWLSYDAGLGCILGTAPAAFNRPIYVDVYDGHTAMVTATMHVLVSATAPDGSAPVYLGGLTDRVANQGDAVDWPLPANSFRDADGDALTYRLQYLFPGYTIDTFPEPEWVEPEWRDASEVGLSVDPQTGRVTGTASGFPAPSFDGDSTPWISDYPLKIVASDGTGTTPAEGVFRFDVNRAPQLLATPPDTQLTVGIDWSGFAASSFFTDPDYDSLQYTFEGLPAGVAQTGGRISGTPTDIGEYTVWVTASDGRLSVSTSFVVTVLENLPPTFTIENREYTATTGVTSLIELPANALIDPERTQITYDNAYLIVEYEPQKWRWEPLFDWMTLLAPGPTFRMQVTPPQSGRWHIAYFGHDEQFNYGSANFFLTVTDQSANRPPEVIDAIPPQQIQVPAHWVYQVPDNVFKDPDGDVLTYSAADMPPGMTFDPTTRTFEWIKDSVLAERSFEITVTASDGKGGEVSTILSLEVYPKERDGHPVESAPISLQSFAASASAHSFSPARTLSGLLRNSIADLEAALSTDADAERSLPASASILPSAIEPTEPTLPPGDPEPTPAPELQENRQEYWFTYDAANRVKVVNGQLMNGQILARRAEFPTQHANGYEITYDEAGREKRVFHFALNDTLRSVEHKLYTLNDHLWEVRLEYAGDPQRGGVQTRHFYDAAGRLERTERYFDAEKTVEHYDGEGIPITARIGGLKKGETRYFYDADSRMISQETWAIRADDRNVIDPRNPPRFWPSWLRFDDLTDAHETVLSKLEETIYVDTDSSDGTDVAIGYDAAGRLKGYRYHKLAKADERYGDASLGYGQEYKHRYTYDYLGRDAYLELKVRGESVEGSFATTETHSSYDAFGRRTEIREKTPKIERDVRRYFAYDGGGQIVSRRDGWMDGGRFVQRQEESDAAKLPNLATHLISDGAWSALSRSERESWTESAANQRLTYANGQQVAQQNLAGRLDIASRLTAFSSTEHGDSRVMVLSGDSLRSIAQRLYGNSNLWYVLAESNALSDPDEALVEGTTLNAPQIKTLSNDAGTFKPYNPSEVSGPTTPSLPYVPKPGCNPAVIIMVIVAVIVTIYTAGAAAGAMGSAATASGTGTVAAGTTASAAISTGVAAGSSTIASTMAVGSSVLAGGFGTTAAIVGGAVGGFAGSVASQVVGRSLGVVSSFSLRQAVGAGITGGITAGIGSALGGSTAQLIKDGASWGDIAMSAVGNAGAGYIGNHMAGVRDTHFSWRSIAANAVSSVVTAGVGKLVGVAAPDVFGSSGHPVGDFFHSMTGSIVSLHARRAFGFDDSVNYGQMLADSFGNALGNAIVGSVSARAKPAQAGSMAAQGSGSGAEGSAQPIRAFGAIPAQGTDPVAFDESGQRIPMMQRMPPVLPDEIETDQRWANWEWATTHGYRLQRPSESHVDYHRGATGWRNAHPATIAHNQWISRSWEGSSRLTSLAGPRIAPRPLFDDVLGRSSTGAKVLSGVGGFLFGGAEWAYETVVGTAKLAGSAAWNMAGASLYMHSGGLLGGEQFGNVVGLAGRMGDAALNPQRTALNAWAGLGDAIGGWVDGALGAYSKGEFFDYGRRIARGAFTVGTIVEAGPALLTLAAPRQVVRSGLTAEDMGFGRLTVVANSLEATDALVVSGRNATQRAASYEAGVRGIYGEAPLSRRTYAAPHNPSGIGRADNVADINGREIAIEAKYTDDWARSPFNPDSKLPWAAGERTRMINQARNYDATFDGIIYHTNSAELANYYSRILPEAGVTSFRFVLTPATRK